MGPMPTAAPLDFLPPRLDGRVLALSRRLLPWYLRLTPEQFERVCQANPDAVLDPTYLGQVIDDTTFSYVCALDEDDDPLTDPSCWIKANPLLGVTITEQYLSEVVAQAKAIPGQLNGILRLHF